MMVMDGLDKTTRFRQGPLDSLFGRYVVHSKSSQDATLKRLTTEKTALRP